MEQASSLFGYIHLSLKPPCPLGQHQQKTHSSISILPPPQAPPPAPRLEHFCRDMLPAPPHECYSLGQWPRTFPGTRASFLLKQNEEGGVYWTGSCVTEQVTVCESSLDQGCVLEEWVVLTGRKGQGRLEDWCVPHSRC